MEGQSGDAAETAPTSADSEMVSGEQSLPPVRRSDVEEAYRLGERNFKNRDLYGISLAATTLDDAGFAGSSLRRADLSHVALSRADFERADLDETDFRQAVLVEANLSAAHATEACFDGAELVRAKLTGANASEASFVGTDLKDLDASEALLVDADFVQADATRATFARANLREANFERAILVDANLSEADLRNASLAGADLSRANLRGARLAGTNFAGARMGGADVEDSAVPFEREIERVGEIVGQARKALASIIAAAVYVLITTATTTDAQLALNRGRLTLPAISAKLPLQQFFVGAAAVLFVLSCYLHLHQARLVRALRGLPQVFPDGSPLVNRVSPWLVTVALTSWFTDLPVASKETEIRSTLTRKAAAWLFDLARWTRVAAFALLWGLAPLTTAVLLLRSLASQRALESYALWAFLVCSVSASWLSFMIARQARGRRFGKTAGVATIALALATLACAPGVLMGIYSFHLVAPREKLSTFEDGQVVGADLEKAPLIGADLRLARLDHAALWAAQLGGANLTGANLTRAEAQLASFEDADLSLAKLSGALLSKAKLDNARLPGSQLDQADVRWASLQHAFAEGANFEAARADSTRFDMAVLRSAKFRKLSAVGAVFEGADLESADFAEANLQGANLRSTLLAGVSFAGTDLSQVDFTGASDLTVLQICASKGWASALLPGDDAPDTRRPFRIEEPGPLRRRAERRCGEGAGAQEDARPAAPAAATK